MRGTNADIDEEKDKKELESDSSTGS